MTSPPDADYSLDIAAAILEGLRDQSGAELLERYRWHDEAGREVIDEIMTILCGRSVPELIKLVEGRRR